MKIFWVASLLALTSIGLTAGCATAGDATAGDDGNEVTATTSSAISNDDADVSPFVSFNPAAFELPEGLVADKRGNFRVSMAFTGEIKKVTRDGVVSHFAQLPGPHTGFSAVGLALDKKERLYVARATFDPTNTGIWRTSADGATVEYFSQLPVGIPNSLAFDDDGNLYASDSAAGAVWRIGPNGQAAIWAQDPLLLGLAGPPLGLAVGANGIAFDEKEKNLYVAVTDIGRIVKIPIKKNGSAGSLSVFKEDLALLKGADGLAFDDCGGLIVAVNRQDRLVRLKHNGRHEVLAEGGLLDFPATPVFVGSKLYLTNFALFRANGFVPGTPAPGIVKIKLH